jgi:BMFP domain-containing protein YqiC
MWMICRAMEDKKATADSFMRFFEAALPDGLGKSLRENMRAASISAFEKLDLVSSEEFAVQTRVLQRTREKLELLEQKVARLEQEKK